MFGEFLTSEFGEAMVQRRICLVVFGVINVDGAWSAMTCRGLLAHLLLPT